MAVDWYKSQGIHPAKLIIGMPLYGRSFLNTDGPGCPFSDIGEGSWERGSYDYRALPLPGAVVLVSIYLPNTLTTDLPIGITTRMRWQAILMMRASER